MESLVDRTPPPRRASGLRALGASLVIPMATLIGVWALAARVGGPLMSPDAWEFYALATHPLKGLGSWRPIGLPAATFVLQLYGLPLAGVCAVLAALRVAVVQAAVTRALPQRWALGATLTFIGPAWVYLGVSYWSETLFCTFLFAITFALMPRTRESNRVLTARFALLGVLVSGLLFTRPAGIFLVPAAMLGAAMLATRWPMRIVGVLAIAAGVATTNVANTGTLWRVTNAGAYCVPGLTALNNLEFCSVPSAAPLCAMDPDRRVVGQEVSGSSESLMWLQFDLGSPYKRFADAYGDGASCAVYADIARHVAINHPFSLGWLLTKRMWASFGPWDWIELSPDYCPTTACNDASAGIERTLEVWRRTQYVGQPLLLLTLVLLLGWRQARTPASLFASLGALAHSAGFALNIPFPVLRYYAIHQALMLLACVLALGGIVGAPPSERPRWLAWLRSRVVPIISRRRTPPPEPAPHEPTPGCSSPSQDPA